MEEQNAVQAAPGKTESPAGGKANLPRPRSVTWLALAVLTIACLNLLRWVLALRDWNFLGAWPGVSPLYQLSTGLIWSLVGCSVWAGLWWGKRWAPGWLRRLAGVYSLYLWLERLFLYDRPADNALFQPLLPGNWGFLLGFNLISLLLVFWLLARSKSKIFFGEVHE